MMSSFQTFVSNNNNGNNRLCTSILVGSHLCIYIYYIDIDEIPGFLLLLKNHIFTVRSEHIICIFHM